MSHNEQILNAYRSASDYPDLAGRLLAIGVQSYTVETASGAIFYRFADGERVLHNGNSIARTIALEFDSHRTIAAIRNNQNGKSDYAGFMDEIAAAGVRFYEATLSGSAPKVTYIGIGGSYDEPIPL